MKKHQAIIVFLLIVLMSGPVSAPSYGITEMPLGDGPALFRGSLREAKLDVPFVPTRDDVLAEMIRMANIAKGDIVYDLGCGDGRVIIEAAGKSGATCIGVDIDPRRIEECRENAAKAGVSGRVKFYEQDLFDTDITQASVVMLYLLPDVNLKLRPKLLRDLKPGSRIVSHNYDMKQWRPDDFRKVGAHTVYLWIVPANVTGTWTWTMRQGATTRSYSMRLEQNFQEAKGWVTCGSAKMPVRDFRLSGERFSFTMVQRIKGENVPVRFLGQVHKGTISGTIFYGKNGEKKKWSARREISTVVPLDGSRLVEIAFS